MFSRRDRRGRRPGGEAARTEVSGIRAARIVSWMKLTKFLNGVNKTLHLYTILKKQNKTVRCQTL